MFLFSLSPEVWQGLPDIWNFMALDNPRVADKFEDEFFEAFEIFGSPPWNGPHESWSDGSQCKGFGR
jgi:hypothetical protein